LRNEFRRYSEIGRLHGGEPWLLREFGAVSHEGRRFVLSEIRYLLRRAPWLIPEALLRTALKYWGYRRGLHAPSRPSTSLCDSTTPAKEGQRKEERRKAAQWNDEPTKQEREDYAAVGFRQRR
jgi:hypothetical protein